MKKIILISMLISFAFVCCKEKIITTDVKIIIDITDENFKNQQFINDLPKVFELMNIKKDNIYSGGQISFAVINHISDSKTISVKLEKGQFGLLGENKLNRKEFVDSFCNEAESSLNKIVNSVEWDKNKSLIYSKLTRELVKLTQSEADRKYVILYSDLLENSELFSFYDTGFLVQVEKMIEKPDSIFNTLLKNGPELPELDDVEIFVITNRDSENDSQVSLAEKFWKSILENKGSTVSFSSVLEV